MTFILGGVRHEGFLYMEKGGVGERSGESARCGKEDALRKGRREESSRNRSLTMISLVLSQIKGRTRRIAALGNRGAPS